MQTGQRQSYVKAMSPVLVKMKNFDLQKIEQLPSIVVGAGRENQLKHKKCRVTIWNNKVKEEER